MVQGEPRGFDRWYRLHPVRLRRRCFRDLKRFRDRWLASIPVDSRVLWPPRRQPLRRYKARGLRVWKSKRYRHFINDSRQQGGADGAG